jgi:hypothetical protein
MSMFSVNGDEPARFQDAADPAKLDLALRAWAKWYSERLNRIVDQMGKGARTEDYSGYEQDLFEALGCRVPDE